MKRLDLWKQSIFNIIHTPLRSVLTMLGLAIGIAAVLAVITLGDAGRVQVEQEMSRLGIDTIRIVAAGNTQLARGSADHLREATTVETTEMVYWSGFAAALDGERVEGNICGCDQRFLKTLKLSAGQFPLWTEWKIGQQVAMIGEGLALRLQVGPGDVIWVAQRLYRICGTVTTGDGVSLIPAEDMVFVPVAALDGMLGGLIHELQTVDYPGLSIQSAQKLIENYFGRTGEEIQTETMQVQMEAASGVVSTFVNVLKWVALVCILVGGIGIMNMLLVNVRDRRREIGIMKSLGATPGQICLLFLLESFFYAVFGGLLGILLGCFLVYVAGACIELPAQPAVSDCIIVFALASGIGMIFGVWPACRASSLSCVDALRQE